MSVKLTLEQDAAEGNAIVLGLTLQISKPKFVGTSLVLPDILSILGNLFRVFQTATLKILDVEWILQDNLSALDNVKKDNGSWVNIRVSVRKLYSKLDSRKYVGELII